MNMLSLTFTHLTRPRTSENGPCSASNMMAVAGRCFDLQDSDLFFMLVRKNGRYRPLETIKGDNTMAELKRKLCAFDPGKMRAPV